MVTSIAALKKAETMPVNKSDPKLVSEYFAKRKKAIAGVLPEHVNPERMLRIALTSIRQTPALGKCDLQSLFAAVVTCSQLGLEPGTPLQHIHLVPFAGKVQVIPGYQGLIQLARNSGKIETLNAHAVYENDEFDFEYGLDDKLSHRPAMGERGELIAVYAVAKFIPSGHDFEVLTKADVEKVMKRTQSKGNSGPWKDHFDAMAVKTAIRRLAKRLPASVQMQRAVQLDEQADAGSQDLGAIFDGEFTDASDQGIADQPPALTEETFDLDGFNTILEVAKTSSELKQAADMLVTAPIDVRPGMQAALKEAHARVAGK